MENKDSSIDPSRLIDITPDEELLCPICHKIFWNPVSCGECQHHFCSACIQQWLKKSQNNFCINGCKFTEKRAAPILYNFLSKLRLKCRNFENGCHEEIRYDSLTFHEKNCQMVLRECEGCKKPLLLKDLKNHAEDCEFIEQKCESCGQSFPKKDLREHDLTKCLLVRVRRIEDELQRQNAEIKELQDIIVSLHPEIKKFKGGGSQVLEEKNKNSKQSLLYEITLNVYSSWGIGGYMFDIEAKNPIMIRELGFMARETSEFKVALYYIIGSFEGREQDSNGWMLLFENKVAFKKEEVKILPVDLDIVVQKNYRVGFYIACNESVDANSEIIGTQCNSNPYKDFEDLKILSGSFHKRCSQRFLLQGAGFIKNVGFLGTIQYQKL